MNTLADDVRNRLFRQVKDFLDARDLDWEAWNAFPEEDLEDMLPLLFREKPEVLARIPHPILRLIGNIKVPEVRKEFVVADNFKVDTSPSALAKISEIGEEFQFAFSEVVDRDSFGCSFLEKDYDKKRVNYFRLKVAATDEDIIKDLQSGDWIGNVHTPLSTIFHLLQRQGPDDGGVLCCYHVNVFYALSSMGSDYPISVRWGEGGWRINSTIHSAFERPMNKRPVGARIFCHKPLRSLFFKALTPLIFFGGLKGFLFSVGTWGCLFRMFYPRFYLKICLNFKFLFYWSSSQYRPKIKPPLKKATVLFCGQYWIRPVIRQGATSDDVANLYCFSF